MDKSWKTYEEVAAYLLNQFKDKFGLESVEGKQKVAGKKSGTEYEIDAKGIRKENEGFIIVECRRYTKSRQSQENLGALAYRIIDTQAAGGIVVSPMGFQIGAKKIAKSENIDSVIINENSAKQNYVLQFLNDVMVGLTERVTVSENIVVKITKAN